MRHHLRVSPLATREHPLVRGERRHGGRSGYRGPSCKPHLLEQTEAALGESAA